MDSEQKDKFLYTIEVVREDRAILNIEAENNQAAYAEADRRVVANEVEWAVKGATSSNIIGRRNA